MSASDVTSEHAARFSLRSFQTPVSVLLLALASFLLHRRTLELWFTGVDCLPLILSGRLNSFSEIPSLFLREFLSAYSGKDIAGSVSVRPIAMLSFAFDYWVWRLDAYGYHLTNLLLHVLNTVAVYVLVRKLKPGIANWAALSASLLFAIHPLHDGVLPHIPLRFDLLLCIFTLLALIALLRFLASSKPAWIVAAFLAAALALASKETGMIVVVLLALTALLALAQGRLNGRACLGIVAGFLLLGVGYWVYRSSILGALEEYPLQAGDFYSRISQAVRYFFGPIVLPYRFAESAAGQLALRFMIVLFVACVGGFVAVGGFLCLKRLGQGFRSPVKEPPLGELGPLFLVSGWILGFFLFHATAYLAFGVFQSWYLYTPLAFSCVFLALLFAQVLQRVSRPRHSVSRVLMAACALPFAVVILSSVAGSCWGKIPDDRMAASSIAREYVSSLSRALQGVPDETTVLLINLPQAVDCEDLPCLGRSYIFEDYSLDSWVKLALPERRLRLIAVSSLRVKPRERGIHSSLSFGVGTLSATVKNTGGRVFAPWRTKAGDYVSVDFDAGSPHSVRMQFDKSVLASGTFFLFDAFESDPLLALGREGPVPCGSSDLRLVSANNLPGCKDTSKGGEIRGPTRVVAGQPR